MPTPDSSLARHPPARGPLSGFFRALGVNAASTVTVQVIGFVRAMILARLLAPSDYGLFSMSTSVAIAFQSLTNFPMTLNIIRRNFQSEAERDLYMNTSWSTEVLRQAVVSALLLLSAFPAAAYFGDERLLPVLAVCSLTPFFSGLTSVGLVLMRREMNFERVAAHRLTTELITTGLAITVAIFTRNVWALAVSQVLGALAGAGLSYAFHPYRPRFHIDRGVVRESFNFSGHLFLQTLLNYLITQFDHLVVGRLMGAASLGQYAVGYRLANLPMESLTLSFSPVLYPSLAKVRREAPGKLFGHFAFTFSWMVTAIAAATLPLGFAAAWVIPLVYGPKWDGAVPLMALLAWIGLLRGASRQMRQLVIALEKLGPETMASLAEAIVMVIASLILVPRYGAWGAGVAGIGTQLLALSLRIRSVLMNTPGNRWRFLALLGRLAGLIGGAYAAGQTAIAAGWHAIAAILVFEVALLGSYVALFPEARSHLRRLGAKFGARKALPA